MRLAAAITLLLAVQSAGASPPKPVREINLNQIVPGHPEFDSAVLTFSPDEKWIAIVGSHNFHPGRGPAHANPSGSAGVFLVPLNGPVDRRIQIDPGLYSAEGAVWSPNSDSLFVQGIGAGNSLGPNARLTVKLFNLRGEEFLRHDEPLKDPRVRMFGFLDTEHLLAGGILSKRTVGLETIDLQGQVVDTWTPPKQWRVVDMSPDRHLLAVLSDDPATKTLVVDYPSKKVILTKDNSYPDLSLGGGYRETSQFFTEGGKTLCSVGSAQMNEPRFDVATECWNVDSGKSIAKFDGFPGGAPAAASSRGSRLILTHYTVVRGTVSGGYLGAEYVVWDFRSGAQVAAWKPQQSTTRIPPRLSGIAISSTGRYVAEIAGDVLRIYELP